MPNAVGASVERVAVGDEVVIHPGHWESDDPWIIAGKDPMIAPSARIWGYDTNFGSFAQFARCQEHQVLPKVEHLMGRGEEVFGNTAILIGAAEPGLGRADRAC
jgi:NADPH:quinone reductase-like Zn-dependent oxidoreductase